MTDCKIKFYQIFIKFYFFYDQYLKNSKVGSKFIDKVSLVNKFGHLAAVRAKWLAGQTAVLMAWVCASPDCRFSV